MTKVQTAIMLEFENLELLIQVKQQYHLKTIGNSVELIIRQWQLFLDDRKKQRELIKDQPKKTPVNPLVNP